MRLHLQAALPAHAVVLPFNYDECVERLAQTVDHREEAELQELANLISQLAVVIE